MENYVYSKKSIITFFIVVIILSALMDYIYCAGISVYGVFLLMWMPAVACVVANVVNLIEKKEKFNLKIFLNRCGFKKCSLLSVLTAIIIPFIYLIIPYRIYWTIYPDNFAYNGVPLNLVLSDCFLPAIIGIFANLLSAAGEEIGWRGFLVPALNERLGTKKSLIISSGFWCLWHFPLLIWGGYMEGTPLWYALIAFVLCIFPVGIIIGLFRINSGSMFPCAFLHASHNNFDQGIFGLITKGNNMMYYVSETGMLTIICVWVIAVIMYSDFRKKH